MTRLTASTSTIFVATREGTQVFHSMQEVPETFRRKLRDTSRNGNTLTILIADKLGRQELIRALEGQPSSLKGRIASGCSRKLLEAPQDAAPKTSARPQDASGKQIIFSLRTWVELLLPVAIGASLWLFIGSRF